MKKALVLILTIVLCVGFCSCGSNAEKAPVTEPVTEAVVQESANVETFPAQTSASGRSEQVQSIIDRLNQGGDQTPSIEEIMALPEIAAAELANEGINLKNDFVV